MAEAVNKLKNRRTGYLGSLTKKMKTAQALLDDTTGTVTHEDAEELAIEIETSVTNLDESNTNFLDALADDTLCQKLIEQFIDAEECGLEVVRKLRRLKRSLVQKAPVNTSAPAPTVPSTSQQQAGAGHPINHPPPNNVQQPSSNGAGTSPPQAKRALDAWIEDLDPTKETNILIPTSTSMPHDEVMIRALFQRNEPDIEVMAYDGSPLDWPRFIQSFHEGVHNLPFLTDTKRMTLLQNHLRGTAKSLTEGLGYSGRSYVRALKDLKSNFGHRSLVARAYINRITKGATVQDHDRKAIREFHITIRDCLLTLEEMCYHADIESTETICQATRRLPLSLRGRWAEQCLRLREDHEPTLTDLENWLGKRVTAMFDPLLSEDAHSQPQEQVKPQQSIGKRHHGQISRPQHREPTTGAFKRTVRPSQPPSERNFESEAKSTWKCLVCNDSHRTYRCEKLDTMSPKERMEKVISARLCLNCLSDDHTVRFCSSTARCRKTDCGRKHHTKLHDDHRLNRENVQYKSPTDSNAGSGATNKSFSAKTIIEDKCKSNVYLQIVPVRIHGPNGTSIATYALLDGACQSSFIKKRVADELSLAGPTQPVDITTLLSSGTIQSDLVTFKVSSIDDDHTMFDIPWAWTLEELHTPPQEIHNATKKLHHLSDLCLKDIRPEEVGIVIGANQPEAILATEIRKGPPGRPLGVKTPLGWTIIGVADSSTKLGRIKMSANVTDVSRHNSDQLLHQQVAEFLKTESVGTIFKGKPSLSVEDKRALKILDEKTVLEDGHYTVPMLFNDEAPQLKDGYYIALKRWESLKNKFKADPAMHEKYKTVIHDLIANQYARLMTAEEVKKKTNKTRYLPHHPIYNPNKPEKLRVVNDAACKVKGKSLNDYLVTGPDLLNSLVGILLRFRRGSVGIAADVEAMFHRVRVPDEDRDCLRFLWKDGSDKDNQPDVYQMVVHIFGAKSSPTCAEYALQRTAKDNAGSFSDLAVNIVLRDFYVDDALSSLSCPKMAGQVANDLIALCQRGGFRLTKWTSNSRETLAALPQAELAAKDFNLELDDLPVERVLGMHWNTEHDVFIFRMINKDAPATKRGALAIASSVFDPLGCEAPFVLRAKLIIQQLWRLKIDWDDQIPEPLRSEWLKWLSELPEIANFSMPRCYSPYSNLFNAKRLEIHTFADASDRAMGVVSYLRIISPDDVISCSFMKANANCAPLKPLGPARLETQACVLAVRQHDLIQTEIDLKIDRHLFWSDSMTAIQYIKNETRRFHVYIANRITEIHESTEPSQWFHCPGILNPADDCSRGLSAADINLQQRFLRGPEFLWHEETDWPPAAPVHHISDEDVEVRPEVEFAFAAITFPSETTEPVDVKRFSRLTRLTRTTAYVLRFTHNAKLKTGRRRCQIREYRTGPLKPHEIDRALRFLIKQAQFDWFREDIAALRTENAVPKSSSLLRLRPVLDEDDTIRVGGRIDKAPIAYDARHQLILPQKHHLSKLLVIDAHEKLAHSGQEHVLAMLRERYWIVNGRVLVRSLVRSCIICHRRRVKPVLPVMAELPAYRVDVAVPCFTNTGVDYFGPLYVKIGRASVKRWCCLFCCLVTRAIHLEVAVSLDTDDFICALRRFASRRGVPKTITSDNGTNFRGADRELHECVAAMNHDELAARLAPHDIEWKFNPPSGPHFGGVWERLVRSVKTDLRVVVGNETLRDDVLYTTLVEIEAIINSRPLTAVSDDPDDCEAITPSHFLIGRSSPRIPPDVPALDAMSHRKRWRISQTMSERFWVRFQKHYLPRLTSRQKWNSPARNLAIHDLVLIVDEQMPRGRWLLARVIKCLPGKDGVVRTAEVKTVNGTLIRPVAKLCLLEGSTV